MDIFNNQEKVIDNIVGSAEKLGVSMPRPNTETKMLVAKRNCKFCNGRGIVTRSFPGNFGCTDSKELKCGCVRLKSV